MKNIFVLFLALCFTSVSLFAQSYGDADASAEDSIIYSTKVYFEKNRGKWIEKSEYSNVARLVRWAKTNSSALIDIKGWGDSSGSDEFNSEISMLRARTIRNYLVQKGIDTNRITYTGMGVDNQSDAAKARRADVVVYSPAAPNSQIQAETIATPAVTPAQEVAVEEPAVEEPVAEEVVAKAKEQEDARAAEPIEDVDTAMQVEPQTEVATVATPKEKLTFDWDYFTLRTDLLYWMGGLMNIGTEYKHPKSDFGYLLNGGYSPFGNLDWDYSLGGWFISPEVRYYIPSNDNWFVGAQLLVGGYNIKVTYSGREGTVIGGGVVGGYKFAINDNFSMDLTLGLGYGTFKYDVYYHNASTDSVAYFFKGAKISYPMPIQAGVNLIWKL